MSAERPVDREIISRIEEGGRCALCGTYREEEGGVWLPAWTDRGEEKHGEGLEICGFCARYLLENDVLEEILN